MSTCVHGKNLGDCDETHCLLIFAVSRIQELIKAATPFADCYEHFLKPMFANEDDDFAMSRWPNGKATLGDYRRLAWLVRDHAGRLDAALEKKPWND